MAGKAKPFKEWIYEIMSDERYQEEYKAAVQEMPNGAIITHPDRYKPEYAELAYEAMRKPDATITHVCVILQCAKGTLHSWIKRHPDLRIAMLKGQQESEIAFRDKLYQHAFEPTGNVNNGLIKILAKNIHNISDEEVINININAKDEREIPVEEAARLYADAMGRHIEIEAESVENYEDVIEIEYQEVDENDE